MKLKLEHLSPYLPFELKYIFAKNIYIYRNTIDFDYEYSKPILRSLSDLLPEAPYNFYGKVEHLGSKITSPASEYWGYVAYHRNPNLWKEITDWEYWFVQLLFEHHFDVFGLIEKGLAVDINTLKNNSYET